MSPLARMKHKGKKNALLAQPMIRTEQATGSKDLNSEMGIMGSVGMGTVKREKVKLGT